MTADAPAPQAEYPWRWRLLAALLILATAGLRIGYVASACPLDLAPDEAHYWDWSRHLDISYYSKGPAVAYLIRAATMLAGPWCEQHLGSGMPAVRLPAILCGALLLVALYVLTVQVHASERLAFFGIAVVSLLPVISAGSLIMTIDAPYCCCWAWALVLGHRAVFRDSTWAWAATGLVVALGILAKYTMVLWVPSVMLFLLCTPRFRAQLVRPGFWLMCFVAMLGWLPILIWNLHHDWASFRHVEGLSGVGERHGLLWMGPLVFLATQSGLLMGFWFVAWLAAMIRAVPWRQADSRTCYLWWMSAVTFAVFLVMSLKTREQANWAVAAYLSGHVLAVGWLARQLESPRRWYRRSMLAGVLLASIVSLSATAMAHHSDWIQPQLLALSRLSGPAPELPLRRVDPTCRLRGWRALAEEVDRTRKGLQQQGIEPVLAGGWWTLPGELGFYCEGHPTVYWLGPATGDRHCQYDYWRPNPVLDEERFLGCTMIVVGEPTPALADAFDRLDLPQVMSYQEHGQPIAQWKITICRGFRGFVRGKSCEVTPY